ncbi:unnamed protein product [Phytophthora fragariaefolia]|uniref:Unnamed protein product n=1 Tax=Phytophthora fragariaefolia TaxID=1490495 RepID=A0A9W6XXA9_9STRA|nr:unnamed protein product [Phytophthora fragariaefolia]
MGPLGPHLVRWMVKKRVSWTPPSNAIRMGEIDFELFAKSVDLSRAQECWLNVRGALRAASETNFSTEACVDVVQPRGAAVSAPGAARALPLAVAACGAAGADAAAGAAAHALGAPGPRPHAADQARSCGSAARHVGPVPVHPAHPRASAGLAAGHHAGARRALAAAASRQPSRPRSGDSGACGLRHRARGRHESGERQHGEGYRGHDGSALLPLPRVAVHLQSAPVAAVRFGRAREGGEEDL